MMFKHILLLVGLSVAAVFFQDQLMHVLQFILMIHNQIAKGLGAIFSFNVAGEVVQSVIALLLIPIVIAALIAIAHFFIKQQHFPHTLHVVWVCWAVLLAAILSQNGHITTSPDAMHLQVQQPPQAVQVQGQPGAPAAPATQQPEQPNT